MLRTVEAVIDETGQVRLLEAVSLPAAKRALVTILEDTEDYGSHDVTLMSEAALSVDWNRPEEDEAWAHIQQAK